MICMDGELRFIKKEEMESDEKYFRNAVVEFSDKKGELKRYWYIQHNIKDKRRNGFEKFINHSAFQAILIKAAHDMWDDEGVNQSQLMRRTLDPAIRNQAVIIHFFFIHLTC